MILVDDALLIVKANLAAHQMLAADPLIGRSATEFSVAQNVARADGENRSWLSGELTHLERETDLAAGTGETLQAVVRVDAVVLPSGCRYFLAQLRDVTAERRQERELAASAVVEPRHRGRDRHAPILEQARVAHDDEQPLRMTQPIDAAKLRDVGMDGELLSRDQQVGVYDCRLDHRAAVETTRRLDESLVTQERLDAPDPHLVAVGVRLAEVIRPRREDVRRLVAAEAAAGADEVPRRVPARRQSSANRPRTEAAATAAARARRRDARPRYRR